ncbi:MAG: hypothetical protein OXI57_00350 [Rhodospirillales bacterium]|nr:hypothetical protein [Rhodospirillales bacterium]
MSVSKDDALSALHDIESAKRRSQTLFGYGLASPHLLLWGTLWIVAGLVGALSPANTGIGWCAVDVVGVLGSGWLVARHSRRCGERGERVRLFRYVGSVAVLAAFVTLTLMVFAPASGDQVLMLFTLVVAAGHTIAGCWLGLRYAALGVALAGLAVGVFVLAPAYLSLIVPFAGGGVSIVAGLWMRRA